MSFKKFRFYKQLESKDCGPSCLRMIAKHYGKNFSTQNLRDKSSITRAGVSLLGISDAAEKIGMRSLSVNISYEQLLQAPLPCIAHWNKNHFIVIYKATKKEVSIADPAHGLIQLNKEDFIKGWCKYSKDDGKTGVCLMLEPSPEFYKQEDEKENRSSFRFLFSYLRPYKKFYFQLILGLLFGSFLQLLLPFLTQSIVDVGISNRNIGFVYLVLIAQVMLTVSRTLVEFIRTWIMLHITTRINISLISDFLIKLMKLPLGFFESKMTGDILQRMNDHNTLQSFISSVSLNTLFSFVNFFVLSSVLIVYSLKIFLVFILGNAVYILWVLFFMKRRRKFNYRRFAQGSANQSNLIQLIGGMQEIKLNNCEKQKRWKWERIQAKMFKISMESLSMDQYQQGGSLLISESKNIAITGLSALAVINGEITLGMMLAIQSIVGMLQGPISQMVGLMRSVQDAKISMERIGEIYNQEDEEPAGSNKLSLLPENKTINISNLSFRYSGQGQDVLKNINVVFPQGKITAIVGTSGSGKTTLLKLLLGFYPPTKGEIKINETNLSNISNRVWRSHCGAVMQEGYIFSDTIAQNISISDDVEDNEKLKHAAKVANINEYIESLPLSYETEIGSGGNGLSQGQKQRMLIARVVYKDPDYIFFDEATNALDANNESTIMENLEQFFKGRTVIVVAHRLSTVKNADQIVVLEKGEIVEIGTHKELTNIQGNYYTLVKNQLELGN